MLMVSMAWSSLLSLHPFFQHQSITQLWTARLLTTHHHLLILLHFLQTVVNSRYTVHISFGRNLQDLGNGAPAKNDWNILIALLGWNNGTSCPAPLTDANVSPSYTSDHPPTCRHRCTSKILRYQQDDCLNSNAKRQERTQYTCPAEYHGYHRILTFRPRWLIANLVAVTGTTESVSPLQFYQVSKCYARWKPLCCV